MAKIKALLAVLAGVSALSVLSDVRPVQASGFSFVPADLFTKVEPVNPGIYGLEARGGRNGTRGDWEIGVGTNTSVPGNFNQGQYEWGTADTLHDFFMEWMPNNNVTVTIGGQTVSYDADWKIGNALEVLVKRNAQLQLDTLDGHAFSQTLTSSPSNPFSSYFITGPSLEDGWTMTGKIAMGPGGGSRNGVLITSGQAVPEPSMVLGALTAGAMGLVAKRKQARKAAAEAEQ